MSKIKLIKMQSKEQLRNNFGSALAITFFELINIILIVCLFMVMAVFMCKKFSINLLPAAIEQYFISGIGVITALAILFFSIFMLGILRWFYKTSCGENAEISEVIYYFGSFKRFGNALVFNLYMTAIYLGSFVLTMIPSGVCTFGAYYFYNQKNKNLFILAVFFGVILLIIGLVAFISIAYRYFLSAYIFVRKDDPNLFWSLQKSCQYMDGYKVFVIKFNLSFILWAIICALGIPILYFLPYFMQSNANCAKWIIRTREQEELSGGYNQS